MHILHLIANICLLYLLFNFTFILTHFNVLFNHILYLFAVNIFLTKYKDMTEIEFNLTLLLCP